MDVRDALKQDPAALGASQYKHPHYSRSALSASWDRLINRRRLYVPKSKRPITVHEDYF